MAKPFARPAIAALLIAALVQIACGALLASPTRTPQATAPAANTASPSAATPTASSPAAAEGGPALVTGTFTYTNDIITTYYVEQMVALIDMHGFITRDFGWTIPIDSQVLGYLNLDQANHTGEYRLQLPVEPTGENSDVNHDGQAGEQVQVYAVSYWPNLTGGPYSEGDDPSRGWPTYLASVKTDSTNKNEVTGGKLIVWAAGAGNQFPNGFGADGLLFTADDPLGQLPAGYTVVDIDQDPFGYSQEAEPHLALFEPRDAAIKDYSALSYSAAFEELFKKVSTEWAFNGTEKSVDWHAVHDEIAALVAAAEQANDGLAFYRAIRAFSLKIPDGHTGVGGGSFSEQDFAEVAGNGFGFAIRELDDGAVIVVFVTPGGPAEAAGIRVGAQVIDFNGKRISQAIGEVTPYSGPFSLVSSYRYQQARYLLRAPAGAEASVSFANTGEEPQTVTLPAAAERDSFGFTSINRGSDPNALPVEARILDSGIGYIKINSNYDDLQLIIRLFQRALATFQFNQVAGVIIDMRQNGGGAPLGLSGFLTNQEITLGQLEYYSDKTGKFEPEGLPTVFYPNQEQYPFAKLAILVGQACASACELESYGFSKVPGAMVVGMYPTAGVEAEVSRGQFVLPDGLAFQTPTGRFLNPDGSLFLEGSGVQPTVKVPINAETVLAGDDVELRYAEAAILSAGEGSLAIEGGPVLLSPAESEQALNAGASVLEALAAESYPAEELSQPDHTYTHTITLSDDQRLIWISGWCTDTQDRLTENMAAIQNVFLVNGQPVDPAQFASFEGDNGGQFCHFQYAAVTQWPSGLTTLSTQVTFTQAINDGTADYPAGTHTYLYEISKP